MKTRDWQGILVTVVSIAVLVLLWEFLVAWMHVKPIILPHNPTPYNTAKLTLITFTLVINLITPTLFPYLMTSHYTLKPVKKSL